ncbi:hypothetical protein BDV59DRAFT_200018 [Aspergillus ambiguus]|uniref:uncharacterized protein n=1 Tax=Aspergillus ambiguus TaxID=176160 RepID=UPI003CCCAB9D
MLLRFLSVTGALCLGSCAAFSLPQNSDIDVVPQPSNSHIFSHFRQIKVPCAECSFADASCSSDILSTTYLTLSFSTENGTLLANDDPIFPSSVPMQFHAVRHWESSQQAVLLAYALDARPLPPQSGALLGEIFLLKLKLFDLHGRPASDHIVSLSLAKDPNGDLLISEVEADPYHGRGRGHGRQHGYSNSWLAQLGESLEAVKSAAQSCWPGSHPSEQPAVGSHPHNSPAVDAHHTMAPESHPHHSTPGYRPPYWAGKGSNGPQMLQPVILPALLGVIAGIVACLTGFIVGRTIIAIYYCFRGSRQRVPVSAVEEAIPSEKERLMEADIFKDDASAK